MKRVVRPEILDSLPPDHPDAVANRHDLRRLNHLLGNGRWIARQLSSWLRPGDAVVEAGAGAGDLGRELWRRLPAIRACRYTGLDIACDRPTDWPEGWDWQRADVRDHAFAPPPRAVVVNFLLHQFTREDLARLGERLAQVPVWVICEPRRSRVPLVGLALLRPLGLHRVSWLDGRTSVRAGFRGRELAAWLGATGPKRSATLSETLLGMHRLVSHRATLSPER
jgi:hypothetical protein